MKDLGIGQFIYRNSLFLALAAAWTATLGSLYFSEVLGYVPCTLCWYQRILMYPLSIIIAVGLVRMDTQLAYYILPFSLFGQAISTYHYLLQKTTIFGAPTACSSSVPCTTAWINWMGFITIPFLAMSAFFFITILTLIAITSGQPEYNEKKSGPLWQVAGVIIVIVLIFVGMAQTRRSARALSLSELEGGDQTPITAPIPIDEANGQSSDGSAAGNVTVDANPAVLATGEKHFAESCAVCHGPDAAGAVNLGPSLVESDVILNTSEAEALAFIRQGVMLTDPSNTTGLVMPPSGGRPDYSDDEILAIIAYLRSLAAAP